MVRRRLPVVHALVGLALGACALPSIEEQLLAQGLAPAALVRLADDRAVAARDVGGRVVVIELRAEDSGGWTANETAGSDYGNATSSTHLVSSGGETGDEWNSYFFGTAPDEVSRVTLEDFAAAGGQVVEGAWVLVLRQKDLGPDQMQWRFIDAFGEVIESGTGIGPPVE